MNHAEMDKQTKEYVATLPNELVEMFISYKDRPVNVLLGQVSLRGFTEYAEGKLNVSRLS